MNIKESNNMIYYHVPDFNRNLALNICFFDYMTRKREFFYEDMEMKYLFDSFPLIWNGGRYIPGGFSMERAKEVIKEINLRGIKLAFTFTNCLLEEKHLEDKDCNEVLEFAASQEVKNSVIINSPLLEEYIRKNYPNIGLILSTTRELKTVEALNKALDQDYELVVIDYNMNHDWDELAKIKDKKRIEFLVNACCKEQCPVRGEHYRFVSEQQLNNNDPKAIEKLGKWNCPSSSANYFTFKNYPNFMGIEEIRTKYVPMGFEHFKLEGRGTNTTHLLEQYVQYMAKPEYKDQVRYEVYEELATKYYSKRK